MKPIVSIDHACFGYGQGKSFQKIVTDISLTIHFGEFILLVGANGSGKSTIIRGMFDLVTLKTGKITWHIDKRDIGYIPQESHIDYDIPANALDVVCTATAVVNRDTKKFGLVALEKVGMEGFAFTRFGSLSGGQKRRVLLARALFGEPKLLVLDEPTVNTDIETEKRIEVILTELSSTGKLAILATTHSENWASKARRYHMRGGVLHE